MSIGLLAGLAVIGLLLIVWMLRRKGGSQATGIDDAGAAIVEFGKVYPALPIRDVILTEDRRAAFLRLADERVGFIQVIGRHYLARLLGEGSVQADSVEDDRVLKLRFPETTFVGGQFAFATPQEAAEVSLWLVNTLVCAWKDDRNSQAGDDRRPNDA